MVDEVSLDIIDNTNQADVPEESQQTKNIFRQYYIKPDASKPMTMGVIISHPGLVQDICLIADSQSHIFGQINIATVGYSDMLKGVRFNGYPMQISRSSLDFGDMEGTMTVSLMDAADELLDGFNNTRGFERAQIIIFDCILLSPYAIDHICRYDVLGTSLSGSVINLTIGNFNSLSISGVPSIYDENTAPGLF